MSKTSFQTRMSRHFLIFISGVFLFVPVKSLADFPGNLVSAAHERLLSNVRYDGSYISMKYPNGDVPEGIGVCTDVVIRSYRKIGIDLQQLVHEDMKTSFNEYPSKRIWGLNGTDTNIDHRRVPNLQVFFERHGETLPVTSNQNDYLPGDIVTWVLPRNLPHIGIVVDQISANSNNPMVIHNVGNGPELSDFLFKFKITGHFRLDPENL